MAGKGEAAGQKLGLGLEGGGARVCCSFGVGAAMVVGELGFSPRL